MAGDWIKMRVNLWTCPHVVRISSALERTRCAAIGALHGVWSIFDQHAGEDSGLRMPREALDAMVETPGMCDAMEAAGWLEERDGVLYLPRYEEHNGSTGKRRASEQKRKQETRSRPHSVRNDADTCPQKSGPEKRREEKRRKDVSNDTSGSDASTLQAVVKEWNLLGITKCSKLTDARRTALRARLRDQDWRSSWRQGIERVRGSPFCQGENDSGWKADIDWFLRPDTLTKILEGKYDKRDGSSGNRNGARESSAEARQRSNLKAIEGFMRRGTVREGDAGPDGAEENR